MSNANSLFLIVVNTEPNFPNSIRLYFDLQSATASHNATINVRNCSRVRGQNDVDALVVVVVVELIEMFDSVGDWHSNANDIA